MEFSYTKTLGLGHITRYDPLISLVLGGEREIEIYCLIDSGSPYNLFSAEYAEAVGIDLSHAKSVEVRGVNGKQHGYLKRVSMRFLGKTWDSDVVFCERSEDHDLVGGQGFFEYFDVCFRYHERKFDVVPVPDLEWKKPSKGGD